MKRRLVIRHKEKCFSNYKAEGCFVSRKDFFLIPPSALRATPASGREIQTAKYKAEGCYAEPRNDNFFDLPPRPTGTPPKK